MKLLHGKALSRSILNLFRAPGTLRCAVAFWGPKWATLACQHEAEVVLDISMGGTTQNALEAFGLNEREPQATGGLVTVLDGLHAKIYLGEQKAIVGSANASSRALGAKDGKPILYEAGIEIERCRDEKAYRDVEKLYEYYRQLSRSLTPDDFSKASLVATDPAARDENTSSSVCQSIFQALLRHPDAFRHTTFIFGDQPINKSALKNAEYAYELEHTPNPEMYVKREFIFLLEDALDLDTTLRSSLSILMFWFGGNAGLYAYDDIVRVELDYGAVSYFGRRSWRKVCSTLGISLIKNHVWEIDKAHAEKLASLEDASVRSRFVIMNGKQLYAQLEKSGFSSGFRSASPSPV